jgi:N-acetyl-anhydromuramyl-L-alanine amidase AmpD
MGGSQKSTFLKHSNDFTIGVLLRNGWTFSQIDNDYIERFIVKLITLGYFD